MKITNTATRLKEIITERGIRQVDILHAAKPHCDHYGVKLEKNDLSQYVNGKVEPGQEKLTILGLALNVSEAWLMGYDVPMERNTEPVARPQSNQNILRIAGRDGSYEERILSDEQLSALKAILCQLKDASDDL